MTIFVVVILDKYREISVETFTSFDEAVDYCISEIGDEQNIDVRAELNSQMFYSADDVEYWIVESILTEQD